MIAKRIALSLLAASALFPLSSQAQTIPDPNQAVINQFKGIGGPITDGTKFSQQSEQYRQNQQEVLNAGSQDEYDKDAEKQAEKALLNDKKYQENNQKLSQINRMMNSQGDEPDTGLFSRARNAEKRQQQEKNLDERDQTPSIGASQNTSPVQSTSLTGYGHALDALTLAVGGGRIVLTGLKAYSNDATCTINDNYVWPCGNEGRAAVESIVSKTELSCQITAPGHGTCYDRETGEPIQKRIARTGFAIPSGKEGLAYEQDALFAKEHHLGLFQEQ